MTDTCARNGIGGVVAQGKDWHTAKVTACYSTKMSLVQQNYPVHKQELPAGVETILQHCDILRTRFTWATEHELGTHTYAMEFVQMVGTVDGEVDGL